jgi:hypothetical protein
MGRGDEMGKRRYGPAWPKGSEEIFFSALGRTCNVRRSALEAGVDPQRAYDRRLADPLFAERWDGLRATGYLRVEERLMRDSLGETDEEAGERPMSQDERELAMNLLKFHHGAVGKAHAGGTPPKRATQAETDAAIMKKLAAVRKRLEG